MIADAHSCTCLALQKVKALSSYLGMSLQTLCLSRVLDHPVDESREIFANALHAGALHAVLRALQEEEEQVGGEIRILESRVVAQALNVFVLAQLVRLNDTARGMILIR